MGNSSLPCSSPSEGFEAGISTRNAYFYVHGSSTKESYRDMTTEFFLEDVADEEPQHFLHACALCKKPLASNRDIYMYRGDTPFCSEECRQEQIEMDEAKESRDQRKFSSSKKASIRDQKNEFSVSSPPGSEEIHVREGMVVAG